MRKYPIFDAGILVCIAFFFLKKRETPAALPRGSCQTGGNVGCGDISVEGHTWMESHTFSVQQVLIPRLEGNNEET